MWAEVLLGESARGGVCGPWYGCGWLRTWPRSASAVKIGIHFRPCEAIAPRLLGHGDRVGLVCRGDGKNRGRLATATGARPKLNKVPLSRPGFGADDFDREGFQPLGRHEASNQLPSS